MIGSLPTALEIGGKEYAIRSDFRVILRIYSAFADPELDEREKCYVCLKCLYAEDIPREHLQEAVNKAYWFVGGGDVPQESVQPAKTIDWEQDVQHDLGPHAQFDLTGKSLLRGIRG